MRSIGYVVYLLQRVLTQYRWEEGKVIKIEQLKRALFILIQNGAVPYGSPGYGGPENLQLTGTCVLLLKLFRITLLQNDYERLLLNVMRC